MSVLLVAPPEELGRKILRRLVAQDDQVRVIEPAGGRAAMWRELGAFVAAGDVDPDLIERAARNVRTAVFFAPPTTEVLDAVKVAGVGRIVLCSSRPAPAALDDIAASGLDYVVLVIPRVRRRSELVAEAIDAADDLPGAVRTTVDLRRREALEHLGISAGYGRPDR